MPVIRVEVPKPTPEDVQRRIRSPIKQAVLVALAPKETKYDYVAVREVIGEVGDGVPLVTVDLTARYRYFSILISRKRSQRRNAAVLPMSRNLSRWLPSEDRDVASTLTPPAFRLLGRGVF